MKCSCGETQIVKIPVIDKHNFDNGKCTICGKADPDYKEPENPVKNETELNDVSQ